MEITARNLKEFTTWLTERGRGENTAEIYCSHLRRSSADPKGLTHRLLDDDLSPNTRRTNLAALAAWALYTEDMKLTRRLKDIRLPPARRINPKIPLELAAWKKYLHHVRDRKFRCEPMRYVILIMAIRGFRSGDVLRIKRREIQQALSTGKLSYEGKGRKRHEFAAAPIRGPLEALAKIPGSWGRVHDLIGTRKQSNSKRVWRASRACGNEVGLAEMYPHRLRHTFATHFLKELKGDPQALMKLQRYMGWASLQTAARYAEEFSVEELDEIGAGLISGVLS